MHSEDLLAGLLAYQLRLVSAGTLAWYVQHLTTTPDARLLLFLTERKVITGADRDLLEKLLESILQAHAGDGRAALESFGGQAAAEEAFARAVQPTEAGWAPSSAETLVADELPHGLPRQITPETAGRYTRGSEYARGGIGRILLVHDEQIGRDVILKELLPHRAVDPTDTTLSRLDDQKSPGSPLRQSASMLARFLQEAKITGQLEHPSIVPVYELGLRTDGQLYYTMKLVRGDTLSVAIANCKTFNDRLALLRSYLDVCEAMAYAHAKGVVHRDLKPSNIMVGEFGECVVLDWGLAKMRKGKDAHAKDMERTASHLNIDTETLAAAKTRPQDVLGTPLYMSPEQARGESETVSYPSDVYSLGVILYEMLSGSTPHRWTNSHDTVRRVATLPVPPVAKSAPRTPPELAAICDKALQFELEDRYASAKELAKDLSRFLEGAVVDAYAYSVLDQLKRIYRQHKPSVLATLGATAAILMMGVVAYVIVLRAWDNEREQRLIAQENEQVARTAEQNAVTARETADAARGEAEFNAYITRLQLAQRDLNGLDFRNARTNLWEAPAGFRGAEWSFLLRAAYPDRFLNSFSESRVLHAVLSPDAGRVATANHPGRSRVYNSRTGELITELEQSTDRPTTVGWNPRIDQLMIGDAGGTIWLWNANSGTLEHRLLAHSGSVYSAAFRPDGSALLTSGDDGWARIWDTRSGSLIHQIETDAASQQVEFAPDGTKFALQVSPEEIGVYDGLSYQRLFAVPGAMHCFSSDGTRLATASTSDKILIVSSVDGTHLPSPPPTDSTIYDIQFSPDGDRLAIATADGRLLVWNNREDSLECVLQDGGYILQTAFLDRDTVINFIEGNQIRRWDLRTSTLSASYRAHGTYGNTIDLAADAIAVTTGGQNTTFQVWDLNHPSGVDIYAFPRPDASRIITSGNGELIALSGGLEGTYAIRKERPTSTLRFDVPAIQKLAVVATNNTNDLLLTAHDAFTTVRWDLTEGTPHISWSSTGELGSVNALAVSPSGGLTATAGFDGKIHVWEGATGISRHVLVGHTTPVLGVAFSPDEKSLASVSEGGKVRLWSMESGLETNVVEANAIGLNCVAFSPDGATLVAGGRDANVHAWDAQSLRPSQVYLGAENWMLSVGVSPDNTIYATDGAGTYFWNRREKHPIAMPNVAVFALDTGSYLMKERDLSAVKFVHPIETQQLSTRSEFESEQKLENDRNVITRVEIVDAHIAVPDEAIATRLTDLKSGFLEQNSLALSALKPLQRWSLSLVENGLVSAVAGIPVSTPSEFADALDDSVSQVGPSAPIRLNVIVDGITWHYSFHPLKVTSVVRRIATTRSEALALLDWLSALTKSQLQNTGYWDESIIEHSIELRPLEIFPRDKMLRWGFSEYQRLRLIEGAPLTSRSEALARLRNLRAQLESDTASSGTWAITLDSGQFASSTLHIDYSDQEQ